MSSVDSGLVVEALERLEPVIQNFAALLQYSTYRADCTAEYCRTPPLVALDYFGLDFVHDQNAEFFSFLFFCSSHFLSCF